MSGPPAPFEIVRDGRGSLIHVRRKDDSECIGCIEVGLFEVVRLIVLHEKAALAVEGTPANAAREPVYPEADG